MIENTRYLLAEDEEFEETPNARALLDAEAALSVVSISLIKQQHGKASKVDLSGYIQQARGKVYEREQVKAHNNQMLLRLVNNTQRLADELKAILTENGFTDFRIEVSDWQNDYSKTSVVKVYKSNGKDYSFVWQICNYDRHHELPCGETLARIHDEIKMYHYGDSSYGMNYNTIAEYIAAEPKNVAKFIDWLMS